MKRRELEDTLRKIVHLYTDAGNRAGFAYEEILKTVDQYIAEREAERSAPSLFADVKVSPAMSENRAVMMDAQQWADFCRGLRVELEPLVKKGA